MPIMNDPTATDRIVFTVPKRRSYVESGSAVGADSEVRARIVDLCERTGRTQTEIATALLLFALERVDLEEV